MFPHLAQNHTASWWTSWSAKIAYRSRRGKPQTQEHGIYRELSASPEQRSQCFRTFSCEKCFVCAFHTHGDFLKNINQHLKIGRFPVKIQITQVVLENWDLGPQQYSSMATIRVGLVLFRQGVAIHAAPFLVQGNPHHFRAPLVWSDSICLLCVMREGLKSLEESFQISVLQRSLW